MISAKLEKIEELTSHCHKVILQLSQALNFKAGQYIELMADGDKKLPFSVASISNDNKSIELHLATKAHDSSANGLVQLLKNSENISITQAKGEAWFRSSINKPKLLVAGGTGFSYTKSIIEQWLKENNGSSLDLFWGAKDQSQLYHQNELEQLAQEIPAFRFFPVVECNEQFPSMLKGNVLDAVMTHFESLSDYDVYLAGPFPMSYKARSLFVENLGANINNLFSDAYAFG